MTISDLIRELQQYPGDTRVLASDPLTRADAPVTRVDYRKAEGSIHLLGEGLESFDLAKGGGKAG